MELAKIYINGTTCKVIDPKRIPAGAVGLKVLLEYDAACWSGLQKTAVFRGCVTRDVLNAENEIIIPAEVISCPGYNLHIGIYGVNTQGDMVIPTLWANLGRIMTSADPSGDESTDPNLPVWAQLQANAAQQGAQIDSNTEAIEQLKQLGPGIDGEDGATFIPHVDGYGNLSWSNDKGLTNPKTVCILGPAGETGHIGPKGETGPQGPQGEKGEPGMASQIVNKSSGEMIVLSDSTAEPLQGLKFFGKTTQNGTPTPDEPVALESIGDDGSVTVNIGISETDENSQSLTIRNPANVPVFLPGIPVTSGGNYTDENGQRWICDEVDFIRGVYVQRVGTIHMDGVTANRKATGKSGSSPGDAFVCPTNDWGREIGAKVVMLCSHYRYTGTAADSATTTNGTCKVCFNPGSFYVGHNGFDTVEAYNNYLAAQYSAGTPVTVQYTLATPVEHNLTTEELVQYATLHTNYPNTTIFNDAGVWMEVQYVADTKLYIDKKFAELSAALINNA